VGTVRKERQGLSKGGSTGAGGVALGTTFVFNLPALRLGAEQTGVTGVNEFTPPAPAHSAKQAEWNPDDHEGVISRLRLLCHIAWTGTLGDGVGGASPRGQAKWLARRTCLLTLRSCRRESDWQQWRHQDQYQMPRRTRDSFALHVRLETHELL
jgi:hypothetical protein